ncbi:hypothetical protein FisN_7Lh252 [Fistulifera solaris]|uniref:E3 UFM1-protein ligase 1-like N-terminal domain-containing protein n=1 Tax=Fistulifera solaris TaxID=1519565 RepID=A0A1Z5JR69_FISSO|nr:hypothetical protein FisN_7Lh252 [Fistulifera solaris]|eukprot:GAX16530.1 hypothetical protein FisN_7Lh252 [Fistulifera solaris]
MDDPSSLNAENPTHKTPSITEEGAKALMELLLQRNCFHDHPPLQLLNKRFIWPHVLQQEINDCFEKEGKLPWSFVQQKLGVSWGTVESLADDDAPWLIVGHYPHAQLWTKSFLQASLRQVWKRAQPAPLPLTQIAKSMWRLPLDSTLQLIRPHVPPDLELRTLDSGALVLVSQSYLVELQQQATIYLSSLSTPTSLPELCAAQQWELSWVIPIVRRTTSGILQGDTYIPHAYRQQQQQTTVDLFQTAGVVTDTHHSIHQLREWLLPYHPIVTLTHALVHRTLICDPLEAALQEADVLELHPWIPTNLSVEDGRLLLQQVLPVGALFVWNDQGGWYFSQPMIATFQTTIMPLLVQEYAHERARELADAHGGVQAILDSRDRKQSTKTKPSIDNLEYGTVPVERVVQRIRAQYCDDEEEDATLTELTTLAFLSSDGHAKDCQIAIRVELQRMTERSQRTTIQTSIDHNPMALERTECFAYACYVFQLSQHFLQYAQDSGGMENTYLLILRHELLEGPGADLAWRMTQYCLFRNNVNDESFFFESRTDPYYHPVDIALRQYDPVSITYDKTKDPLAALRRILPGSTGVTVARLWELCHGTVDDINALQEHLQENCLPLIGLPYKVLDKKNEKKFLSSRRDLLLKRLQSEANPALVLDWAIMLWYQHAKNLVVSGSLLRGPILRLLVKERKITSEVADDLMAMAGRIANDETVEDGLLERVRNCALKRK